MAKAVCIPAQVFTHVTQGAGRSESLEEQLEMLTGHGQSFCGFGGRDRPSLQAGKNLADQPRVAIAAPGNHDRIATGLP